MQENNQNFNHIKIHTQYSICEGAIKIDDLKNFCKENKIKAVGLSDTNNLCGALEFSEEISKAGTQPIIGSQINFKYNNDFGAIPLIAKNQKGYETILKLSSDSYLKNKDHSFPFCDIENLLDNSEGIIVLSGSIQSLSGNLFLKNKLKELDDLYNSIQKTFENNFYIEIQRHNDQNEKQFERYNLNLSDKHEIPIIATHEVFYLNETMHEAHDALLCIKNKTYINDKDRLKLSKNHNYKNDKEMYELFSDLPEALLNNYYLPFKCNFKANSSKPLLPEITSDKNTSPDKILEVQALEGLKMKFKNRLVKIPENHNKDELFKKYTDRLYHEINIISQMKYSSYFLIVSDYIRWSKKQ